MGVLPVRRVALGRMLGAAVDLAGRVRDDGHALVEKLRIGLEVVRVHHVARIVDVLEADGVRELLGDRRRGGGSRVRVVDAVEREGDVALRLRVTAVQRRDAEDPRGRIGAGERVGGTDHAQRVLTGRRARLGDHDIVLGQGCADGLHHRIPLGSIPVGGVGAGELGDLRGVGVRVVDVTGGQLDAVEGEHEDASAGRARGVRGRGVQLRR